MLLTARICTAGDTKYRRELLKLTPRNVQIASVDVEGLAVDEELDSVGVVFVGVAGECRLRLSCVCCVFALCLGICTGVFKRTGIAGSADGSDCGIVCDVCGVVRDA